jgi:hypothetical protein
MSEPIGKVEALVRALGAARCASMKNLSQGMDFIRSRQEWFELTGPALREELIRFVEDSGGTGRMNAWARQFYEAALEESARRSRP